MANEYVAQLTPHNAFRETAVGYEPVLHKVMAGDACGLRLNKMDTCGYIWFVTIPGSITMGTGLTFVFMLTDSGEYATDLGKVVRLGVTVKALVDGENLDMDTAAGTEQAANFTLKSTSGNVVVGTPLAIAAANLDSAAVGDTIGIRIRRISSNAADTCLGSAILVNVGVKNT